MLKPILTLIVFIVAAGIHNYLFGNHHSLAVGIYNGVLFGLGGLFWSLEK